MKPRCAVTMAGAAMLLCACGNTDIRELDVDTANALLDDFVCRKADSAGITDAGCRGLWDSGDEAALAEARLLRAYMVVAAFARYGAARLESYSDDLPGDAARMLARIEHAQAQLEKANEAVHQADVRAALYPLNRVDALLAVIGVIDAATRPTLRGLFRFGLALSAGPSTAAELYDRGGDILKGALKDALYMDAYRVALIRLTAYGSEPGRNPASFRDKWGLVAGHVRESCELLSQDARVENHCRGMPP